MELLISDEKSVQDSCVIIITELRLQLWLPYNHTRHIGKKTTPPRPFHSPLHLDYWLFHKSRSFCQAWPPPFLHPHSHYLFPKGLHVHYCTDFTHLTVQSWHDSSWTHLRRGWVHQKIIWPWTQKTPKNSSWTLRSSALNTSPSLSTETAWKHFIILIFWGPTYQTTSPGQSASKQLWKRHSTGCTFFRWWGKQLLWTAASGPLPLYRLTKHHNRGFINTQKIIGCPLSSLHHFGTLQVPVTSPKQRTFSRTHLGHHLLVLLFQSRYPGNLKYEPQYSWVVYFPKPYNFSTNKGSDSATHIKTVNFNTYFLWYNHSVLSITQAVQYILYNCVMHFYLPCYIVY